MNSQTLLSAMGGISDAYLQEAAYQYAPIRRKRGRQIYWGALAACLALACVIAFPHFSNKATALSLPHSDGGVQAHYIKSAPDGVAQSGDLAWLSEDELLAQPNTAIFRGTIIEIRNIEISYHGVSDYRAVAKIQVSSVVKGTCKPGEVVSVLLPCPVAQAGTWVEDCEVASAMRAGMEGIFIPTIYDENAARTENGATLYLKDLADYGLSDGRRFAFLQTEKGLLFANEAYPSFAQAVTLDDVEAVFQQLLSQNVG